MSAITLRRITLRLPDPLAEDMGDLAAVNSRSLNATIIAACEMWKEQQLQDARTAKCLLFMREARKAMADMQEKEA